MVSLNSMQTVQQNFRFNLKNQQNVNSRAKKNIKSQPNFGMKFVMPKAELEDFLHSAAGKPGRRISGRKNYEECYISLGDALQKVNKGANENFASYITSTIKELKKSGSFKQAWKKVFGEPYKKTEGISDKITEKVVPGYKDLVVPIKIEGRYRENDCVSSIFDPEFFPSDDGVYAKLATENSEFCRNADDIFHADDLGQAIKDGFEDVIEDEAYVRSKDVVDRLKNIIESHDPPMEEKYNDIFI